MSKETDLLDGRVLEIVNRYLSKTRQTGSPVTRHLPPEILRERLDLSLPAEGCAMEDLFDSIEDYLEYSPRTGHRQFFNQLWSGFTVPGFLGDLFASLANTSMYTYEVAPVATLMETELIRKMGDLAGFPEPEGLFVSGGSNGNLIAMMIARNRAFPELKKRGFREPSRLVALVSDQSHYSFGKAANLLGIGEDNVLRVRSDEVGRMIPEELERTVAERWRRGEVPFFVAATAGTTVNGAFDPCGRIARVAREHGLWMHVDGSFGGTVLLSPRHRVLLEGLEEADSFVWDPHKLMGLPLICSAFLVREKGNLLRTVAASGTEYLFHDEGFGAFDLGPISLQCGRRVDALKLWLSWRYYGDRGYAERVDRFFELAAYAEQQVEAQPRLELLAPRSSVNVCFRCLPPRGMDPNAFNLELREELARKGRSLVNYSYLGGRVALRWVVANHEVTRADVDTFFDNVLATAEEIRGRASEARQ